MNHLVYGVAAAATLALSSVVGLSAAGWAQSGGEAQGNPPTATAAVAPAQPSASANSAPQANITAKPSALTSSTVCPPAHRRVARVQRHHYRRHFASSMSTWETQSETTEVETVPTPVVEGVPTQVVAITPPPVYVAPPPLPAPVLYASPAPRPWHPAPWPRHHREDEDDDD